MSTIRRLARALDNERWLLAGTTFSGLASVALTAAGPLLLGRATDLILTGTLRGNLDFAALAWVLLAATAAYLTAGVSSVIQAWAANLAAQRVLSRLRDDLEVKLSRVPLGYLDGHRRGEILSRVTNDIDNLGVALQQALGQLVIPLFSIVATLAVMFWISWLLALIALVTAPLSILVAARLGKRAQPAFRDQMRHTGRLNGHIEEMYAGHALIKAFGREQQATDTFTNGNRELTEATRQATAVSSAIQPLMMFLSNLNYVVIAVVGGVKITTGALTVGDVQAFIQYSRQYSQPFSYLASMIGMVQSGLASADRVFELLDAPEQTPDPSGRLSRATAQGGVAFEDVSFRYAPDEPLIDGLTLTAEPGHTVAIVGPTGAGKTTLVNLLMRFYEIHAGRITLDGADIATMPRAHLRDQIGMVLQDTWLFGGTIADNISYGAANATREEIVAAAQAAHADRFIRTLPDGYDTRVDDGSALSAGEKQLLTIARAFLADPPILILDEATSSVDTRTEALIQQALARLREGRTAFVIAHRLSTIREADTIVVMEGGAIAEQGTHQHLLTANGPYARLYAAQFATAAEI
jgi:ABC-type multidrug transport system fused ATPase/permease subunit